MPFKRKEDREAWNKKYYLDHKERFKEYYQTNREHLRGYQRIAELRRRREFRTSFLSKFSFQCISCNKELIQGKKMYAFHEVNGIDHSSNGSSIYYYREGEGRFVPLCKDCHKTFHTLMLLGKSFEEILLFTGWRLL